MRNPRLQSAEAAGEGIYKTDDASLRQTSIAMWATSSRQTGEQRLDSH